MVDDSRSKTKFEDSAPGSEGPLATAYRRDRGFSSSYDRKLDFYKIRRVLELIPVSVKHWIGKMPWGADSHARRQKTLEQSLASLEKGLRN